MIEADFQREYNINLAVELPNLSWRRFVVLLKNLSVDSCLVLFNSKEKPIEDATTAERAIEKVWG